VTLAPGHYTVQTAVVDWPVRKVSANQFEVDCAPAAGAGAEHIVLVRRPSKTCRVPLPQPIPSSVKGSASCPSLTNVVEAGTTPSVFFCAYPDRSNAAKMRLQAQFLGDGRVLQDQGSELPRPTLPQRSGPDSGSRPARRE